MNGLGAVLVTITAVVAGANWWSRWRDDRRLELVTKPAVTALLIALALVLDADPSGARVWFVAGLVACLAGDVALLPAVDSFIAGLGSFLVGHVLFAVGALVIGVHWAWLPLPLAVVGAAGLPVVRPIVRGAGPMAAPVIGYFTVISGASALLAITGRPWAIAGAVAFMVSDSILGTDKFARRLSWAPVAVMVTYHLALTGLALTLI